MNSHDHPWRGLEQVTGVSPIIFQPHDWDLLDFIRYYYAYLVQRRNFAVITGTAHELHPDDGRMGVAYEFEPGQQFGVVIAGEFSLATAPRQLYFVTHGFGHAIQHLDECQHNLIEDFIHPASQCPGSRRPDEIIYVNGEYRTFGDCFTQLETEATRIGTTVLFAALRSYTRRHEISPTSESFAKMSGDLAFLMNLYLDIDHPYHNNYITGDFHDGDWLGHAGKKLFEVGILPHKARLTDNKTEVPEYWRDELCRIANIRGHFIAPSSGDLQALWAYRLNILEQPHHDIAFAARHENLSPPKIQLPSGSPLSDCARIMRNCDPSAPLGVKLSPEFP